MNPTLLFRFSPPEGIRPKRPGHNRTAISAAQEEMSPESMEKKHRQPSGARQTRKPALRPVLATMRNKIG
jgi:hypothetical protein